MTVGTDGISRSELQSVIDRTWRYATARYLTAHPGQDRALDSWPPQLAEERAGIRAAAADLPLPQREAADRGAGEPLAGMEDDESEPIIPGPDAGTPHPGPAAAADAGTAAPAETASSVQVSGDLRRLLSRRGPPVDQRVLHLVGNDADAVVGDDAQSFGIEIGQREVADLAFVL